MQEMMVACFRIDQSCEHERSLFKEQLSHEGVRCTKHPREVLYAKGALNANRNLFLIYIVRDPRDVIVSRHAKNPARYFTSLSFYVRADRYARAVIDHPRFLVVRYEDLVTRPDAVQDELMRRCPFLEKRHPFSEFHLHARVSEESSQALNGVRPPDARSVGRWRNDLARVAAQFRKFPKAADILIRHGYERDASWMAVLPAAESGVDESLMEDKGGLVYEARVRWRVIKRNAAYWMRCRLAGD